MTTKLTTEKLKAIYNLVIGATEGGKNSYKFSNAWDDFTSIVGCIETALTRPFLGVQQTCLN